MDKAILSTLLTSHPGRYARALFNALPMRDLGIVNEQLKIMRDFLETETQETRVLTGHMISSLQKEQSMRELAVQIKFNVLLTNFLCILCKEHRLSLLPKICELFEKLLNVHRHYQQIRVITATRVTTSLKKDIQKAIAHLFDDKCDIVFDKDSSILGGLCIEMDNTILDASFASQLQKLAKTLRG